MGADGRGLQNFHKLAWPLGGRLTQHTPGSSEAVPSFPPSHVNEEKEMKTNQTYVHIVCVYGCAYVHKCTYFAAYISFLKLP